MAELKSRRLEIDALRVLRAVEQHGGITRAAEALGISLSTAERHWAFARAWLKTEMDGE